MRRPLTPAEAAIVLPLVERQQGLQERMQELELGIRAVLRAFGGTALERDGDRLVVVVEEN